MEEGQFINRSTFRIQQTFPNSTVKEIWSHLVDHEKRNKWFPEWELDPGKSMIGSRPVNGPIKSKVLVAAAPSHLKFTWPRSERLVVGGVSLAEIKLHQRDETVVLTLTLSGLTAPEERTDRYTGRTVLAYSPKVDDAVSAASCWHCRLEMLHYAAAGHLAYHPILNDSTFADSYWVRYKRLH